MGVKYNLNVKLKELIKRNDKIHVYGESGSGKTFQVIETLKKMEKENVLISYARSEEDLLNDFGDLPFQKDADAVFVLEGDFYYWKKYGLVKKIIEECKNCLIIITVEKDKPTKNITKLLKQIKIQSPTASEVIKYIKNIDPNWNGNILDIYDKNWNVVLRRLEFGELNEDKIEKTEYIDSKSLSYKLIKGEANMEDFDRCIHPTSFVINWLGYNATGFWSGKNLIKNLEIISWCDANKYSLKEKFIRNELMSLTPSFRKSYMNFPPWKKKKEDEKADEKIIVRKVANRKSDEPKKKEKEYKGLEAELGGFLML